MVLANTVVDERFVVDEKSGQIRDDGALNVPEKSVIHLQI